MFDLEKKIFEELISKADSFNTYDLKNIYSIVEKNLNKTLKNIINQKNLKVPLNFEYNRSNNPYFLNVDQLHKLINDFKKKIV